MRSRGVRVAGVVEVENPAPRSPCAAFVLRDIVTGLTYLIYQNLGLGSTACRLDARGVIAACEAVRRQIRAGGCDLVVLSKFGKLEAARTGMTDAFAAAAEAGIPIVTAVAPPFAADWERFSAPLADFMPPCAPMLDEWWHSHHAVRRSNQHLPRAHAAA